MLQASRLRFARSSPIRQCGTLFGLALLLFVVLLLWLPTHAQAQSVPPELSNQPKDVRFLVMPLKQGGHCSSGMYKSGGHFGPYCNLSINECLAIAGSHIERASSGNWHCDPPRH
jgi:hypothetical protein